MKPYVTEEVYSGMKNPFIAPPAQAQRTPHGIYLNQRLTQETIEALGWTRWDYVQQLKESFFETHSRRPLNLLNFLLAMVMIGKRRLKNGH